jgi:hypothetical protein
MELAALLRRLEGKVLSGHELGRYLGTKSLDELLLTLHQLTREDYFKYEITLSKEYFDRQKAHRSVLYRRDVLVNAANPFGVLDWDTNGISVKSEAPLSDAETIDVIRKLPDDMAERYLQFKLRNIGQEKLYKYVAAQQKAHGADEDDFYDRVEHHGLVVNGSKVTYDGEPIKMGFQHRQALRVFIGKEGRVCSYDDFTDDVAGIFRRQNYRNINHTIRNLIYEIRIEIKTATNKNLIANSSSDGWYLDI